MTVEVQLGEKLRKFVNEFNITVDLFVRFLPNYAPRVENLFYDFQSLAESLLSKCFCYFIDVIMIRGVWPYFRGGTIHTIVDTL